MPDERTRIMSTRTFRLLAAAAIALSLGALSGCMTATPYQPYVAEGAQGTHGGYSEQMLAPDRYRVIFHGNELASRERVEGYLLYRAAELTVARGFDWFVMDQKGLERDVQTYAEHHYSPSWGYPYWRPSWGYYRGGLGWDYWAPWRGDPFWADHVDLRTVEAFEASAEVTMHKGPVPAGDPRAIDARAAIARLGPTIELPKRG
jgi:hypothetical protein